MKVTELRAGMRVLFRSGVEGLVVESKSGMLMVIDRHIEPLTQIHIRDGWDEDLLYLLGSEGDDRMSWDIMAVWLDGKNSGFVCDLSRKIVYPPQWKRRSRDVPYSEAMKVLKDHFGLEVNLV